MQLQELLYILKVRWRMALTIFLVSLLSSIVVLSLFPKKYRASATVVVLNYKGNDPVSGSMSPGQLVPAYLSTYIATQVDILKSRAVATIVAERLALADRAAWKESFNKANDGKGDIQDWLADQLLSMVKVKPGKESNVVQITAQSSDPVLAANIANGFVEAYQQVNIGLELNPTKAATLYLDAQVKELRERFEKAQNEVTAYRNQSGIVDPDQSIDVETTRLNDLARELVRAQAALSEAIPRKNGASGRDAGNSPDLINNTLIQNLRFEIGKAMAKLGALSGRYTTDHPLYRQQLLELEHLQAELKAQISVASKALGTNAKILGERESELHHTLEMQRERVRELNQKRDHLFLLTKEMENAQQAYQTVSQRLAQTRILGQANQTDISLLAPAYVPLRPAVPNVPLSLLLTVLVGLMLACGITILMEVYDRRIRFVRDVTELLGIPVLAEVGEPRLLHTSYKVALPRPQLISLSRS
ncbi:chain length determinant protein EpsF [Noviherbaspirillum malthae]|uniref:chain length determinant protein EpsF n=1 Tax=Noviherbaspirillum malthae TaxID=1260987 RepID=UPI00188E0C6B|nr:chain length determinant protein EpsF [Noviherbaspirillum malthae]